MTTVTIHYSTADTYGTYTLTGDDVTVDEACEALAREAGVPVTVEAVTEGE